MVKKKKRAAVADIVDAIGDGIILMDMDGKITRVNPAWEKK